MKNAKPTLAAGDSKDQNYEKSSSLIYSIGFRELYREAVLGKIFAKYQKDSFKRGVLIGVLPCR